MNKGRFSHVTYLADSYMYDGVVSAIALDANRAFEAGNYKLASLAVDDLIPTQRTVVNQQVDFYKEKLLRGEYLEPIWVVEHDGQRFIWDGHTRVQAAKELDLDRLEARLAAL